MACPRVVVDVGTLASLSWHVGKSPCNFGALTSATSARPFFTSAELFHSLSLSNCLSGSHSQHLGGTILQLGRDSFGTSARQLLALRHVRFATSARPFSMSAELLDNVSLSNCLSSSCSKHLSGTVLQLRHDSFGTSVRQLLALTRVSCATSARRF